MTREELLTETIKELESVIKPDWAGTIHLGKSEKKKFFKALRSRILLHEKAAIAAVIPNLRAVDTTTHPENLRNHGRNAARSTMQKKAEDYLSGKEKGVE